MNSSSEAVDFVAVPEEPLVVGADEGLADALHDRRSGLSTAVLVGEIVRLRHTRNAGELGLAHARRLAPRPMSTGPSLPRGYRGRYIFLGSSPLGPANRPTLVAQPPTGGPR